MAIGSPSHAVYTNYEPTSYDPGWQLTLYVIIICLAINVSVPLMIRFGRTGASPKKANDTRTRYPTQYDVNDNDIDGAAGSQGSDFDDDDSLTVSVFHGHHRSKRHRTRVQQELGLAITYQKAQEYYATELGPEEEEEDFNLDSASSISSASRGGFSMKSNHAVAAMEDENHLPDPKDIYQLRGSLYERLLSLAAWDEENKNLIRLWVPFSVSGVFGGLVGIAEVAIIGHLIGVREVNAVIMVELLIGFSETLTSGFTSAMGVLIPQARGAKNYTLVGRYLQLGIILYLIAYIPTAAIWSVYTKDAVLWFGFDQETAAIARKYAYPFIVEDAIAGISGALEEFLITTDHVRFATLMSIGFDALEFTTLFIMALAGIHDLFLIGTTIVLLQFLYFVAIFAMVLHFGWLNKYWEGLFLTNSFKDRRAVRTMFSTAIPYGINYILTYGEWELLTLFAKIIGPAEVAAWGILGEVWDTFEYITEGLADATEIRVGFRMGAGQIEEAKYATSKAMYLAFVSGLFSTGVLFLLSEWLPVWVTPDPTLQRLIFDIIPLIGFGQLFMSVGYICWGAIAAQGRVSLSTGIEIVTSWGIVVPLSAALVYVLNYNLLGLAAPLVVGYTIGCATVIYLLFTSDWEALSKIVIERNGELDYLQFSWSQLPPKIRQAAQVLGYTQELWDEDEEPESCNKAWNALTSAERKAAKALGYDEVKWNQEENDEKDGLGDSENESTTYDDYDWEELPPKVIAAAKVLGYTKELWDGGVETESSDKSWRKLSQAEQKAAEVMGYSKASWDGVADGEKGKSNATPKSSSHKKKKDKKKHKKKGSEKNTGEKGEGKETPKSSSRRRKKEKKTRTSHAG